MEFGAIFIVIAVTAFLSSYLGNKLSSPRAAAIRSNDSAPPSPKATTYEFEYKSFGLRIKVEDGILLDNFDKEAIQSRFEAFAEQEERGDNSDWKIFLAVKLAKEKQLGVYFETTVEDISLSGCCLANDLSAWFAISMSLAKAFEGISEYRDDDDNDDDNNDDGTEAEPNDPVGSAVDKIFA